MVLRIVGRIIVVAFAFFLATLAAGFVLFTLGLERVTGELHRLGSDNDTISTSLSMMDQGLALVAGVSIIPTLLVIFTGEIARIRSLVYYVAGGGRARRVAGVRHGGLRRRLRLLADRRPQRVNAAC